MSSAGGKTEKSDRHLVLFSTLDIGPTLLELAGIEAMPNVQGLVLPRDLEERKRRGVLTEATMKRNLKAHAAHEGLKLIVEFEGASTDIVDENAERETVGLFDWNVDAKEKNPIKTGPAAKRCARSSTNNSQSPRNSAATPREHRSLSTQRPSRPSNRWATGRLVEPPTQALADPKTARTPAAPFFARIASNPA
ncbi:MAG: hypothetical protein VX246_16755 [Myxococcota bacterium]|nr:hypothetical protein [Myxococcota bacterium]